jgi:hypothetical protein
VRFLAPCQMSCWCFICGYFSPEKIKNKLNPHSHSSRATHFEDG